METVWQFPNKLNMELPYDPAILLLGIIYVYPKEMKRTTQPNAFTHIFIEALLAIAKRCKWSKCPSKDA